MKKYKLDNLNILTIKNDTKKIPKKTKLICERRWSVLKEKFILIEIFTDEKITNEEILKSDLLVEPFADYFPTLAERCKDIKFSKIELLNYYNEINKIELLKNIDEEDIKKYLIKKNAFAASKICEKRYSK